MKRTLPLVLLLALGVLLVGGIIVLLSWRLDKGDTYPRYSTLRSDPLGARAFYETLEKLYPGKVHRNFMPLGREDPPQETTWFFLGMGKGFGSFRTESGDDHLKKILTRGGDVVIALSSQVIPLHLGEDEEDFGEAFNEHVSEERRERAREKRRRRLLYGIEAEWIWGEGDLSIEAVAADAIDDAWPPVYASRSARVFSGLSGEWKVLYTSEENEPLIVQREVGNGRLTLINDSYLFSNEALFNDRQSALIEALLGYRRQFVIDETHLGTSRNRGVMDLIRDYRLQGVIAGFVLLALLYIWRSSRSLLPPYPEVDVGGEDQILGESSNEGFEHFLAHHLSSQEIVKQCLTEWERSWGARVQGDPALAEQLKQASLAVNEPLGSKKSGAVELYNRLNAILTRKHLGSGDF